MLLAVTIIPTNASEVTGSFYERPTFVGLSTGHSSACAVSSRGEVWCWGSNNKFQAAAKNSLFESTPLRVSSISNATQVAVGREHACALLQVKRVVCWGSNEYGQLGTGFEKETIATSPIPEYVNGVVDVESIFAGDDHNCAITASRELFCWGYNNRGQLGQPSSTENLVSNGRLVIAHGEKVAIENVVDAGLGTAHTCVVTATGFVYCWGTNFNGQLAQGWRVDKSSTPLLVGSLTNIRKIDSSGNSICVSDVNKIMQCWGSGESGQLGNLDTVDFAVPTNKLSSLATYAVEEFSAGVRSTCAEFSKSLVSCWGSTTFAQVGGLNVVGTQLNPFTNVPYTGTDTLKLSSGSDFSCTLTGTVWCWGRNNLGQLGRMTSGVFGLAAQINNPSWDLGPNSLSHSVSDNVVTMTWPAMGILQRYARVESDTGKLLCQTNATLYSCDFIAERAGTIRVVLYLTVVDPGGTNRGLRAEYSIEVKSILSAAELKLIKDREDAALAELEKWRDEERKRIAAENEQKLALSEAKLAAAEAKLTNTLLVQVEASLQYDKAKARSENVTNTLNAAVEGYIENNASLASIAKQLLLLNSKSSGR